jgi:hypothetical protein
MEDTEPTVVTNVATLRMIEKGNAVLAAIIASFTGSQADKSEAVLAALTFIYRDGNLSRNELRAKAVALADVMGYRGNIDGIVTSIVEEEERF